MSSMFANLLPVFAAMDAAAPKDGPAHASGMEDFPDEEQPTRPWAIGSTTSRRRSKSPSVPFSAATRRVISSISKAVLTT